MTRGVSRRNLLQGLVITPIAIIASPVVSSIGDFLVSPDEALATEEMLKDFVRRVYRAGSSNQFVVKAGEIETYEPIMGAAYSLKELYKSFGHSDPTFSDEIDYSDARQCENNFRKAEEAMRSDDLNLFAGVKRSRFDSDLAMLGGIEEASDDDRVGVIVRASSLRRDDIARASNQGRAYKPVRYSSRATRFTRASNNAQASTQHGGSPAITLTGDELDVARIVESYISAKYSPSPTDRAQIVTYKKREEDRSEGVPITILTNAYGGHVAYTSQPSGRASAGVLGLHVPGRTNPKKPPLIGLVRRENI